MGLKGYWGEGEDDVGLEKCVQSLIWNFAYPDAPGGLDNPIINPLGPGAPSLCRLGCSKMLVTVAGKDHLKFRDRAVVYCEGVKKSGWKGEVTVFEEEEEDHVYFLYDLETDKSKRLIKILVDFLTN